MRDRVRTYTAYQWAIVVGDGALGGHGSVPIPRPVGLAQPVRHLRLCHFRSHGLSAWEYRAGPLRVVGRSQGTVWSSARTPWWRRVGWHPVAPHPRGRIWRFRAGRRSARFPSPSSTCPSFLGVAAWFDAAAIASAAAAPTCPGTVVRIPCDHCGAPCCSVRCRAFHRPGCRAPPTQSQLLANS